jgi:hypothetical protein
MVVAWRVGYHVGWVGYHVGYNNKAHRAPRRTPKKKCLPEAEPMGCLFPVLAGSSVLGEMPSSDS